MALPLLFLAGATVVRAATPAIAKYLVKQGLKRATGAAARKPVSSVITSVKQAQKLKPATKVAGKKPAGSVRTGSPTTPKKPLRADPKKAPDAVKKRLADKNKKPSALGTRGQKSIVTGGLTAASLATMIPKKDTGKATAKPNKGTPIQEDLGSGRRNAKRSEAADKVLKNVRKAEAAKKEKNFNVGVSRGGVSFNKAFAHFRKKGNKTFTWNDKKYTTELASEKKGKK